MWDFTDFRLEFDTDKIASTVAVNITANPAPTETQQLKHPKYNRSPNQGGLLKSTDKLNGAIHALCV